MQLRDRDVRCDEMYILSITTKTKKAIRELILSKRSMERKELPFPKNVYVVYSTCLGDAMDFSGSEGFVFDDMPEVLFIDPKSNFSKNAVIAHELIHLFQSRYYFDEGLYDYDDWTEVMARDLEKAVETILFKLNKSKLVFVSKDSDEIESIIEGVRIKESDTEEIYSSEQDDKEPKPPSKVIDEYFEKSLKRHMNMEEDFEGYDDEDDF